ncbi:hypothetical protein [Flavobacterium sp.]|uniref:hypothetical protein n=1 Tax=Flavobacterium sp. TaxID=239 RepID=UPI003752C7B3
MKKIIFLLPLLFCMCTKSDESVAPPIEPKSTFAITATPSSANVAVDENFTITVAANETIKGLGASLDNFATGGQMFTDFGTSRVLYFNTLGAKTIAIKATSASGAVFIKNVNINVTRGNALKITGMQITAFDNMNNTWDPEFGPTDPNRLADVLFNFNTSQIYTYFETQMTKRRWYLSTVKQNQGDLTWDLTNANLYINPNREITFSLGDEDTPPVGQNLIPNLPDYRIISFANYLTTKPTTITYSFPDANLSFIMTVEWAN